MPHLLGYLGKMAALASLAGAMVGAAADQLITAQTSSGAWQMGAGIAAVVSLIALVVKVWRDDTASTRARADAAQRAAEAEIRAAKAEARLEAVIRVAVDHHGDDIREFRRDVLRHAMPVPAIPDNPEEHP